MSTDDRSRSATQKSPISAAFVENGEFLQRFLRKFLKSPQDIEDVSQEAFLRAFAAEQKKSINQPKAFLFRVARNVALTKLTRKSAQITEYIEESTRPGVYGEEPGLDVEWEAREKLGLYCEAVAELPLKCREVFLLRKVHGLSHKEIAERMELSVSSVEKYLRKGLLACQSYLASQLEPNNLSSIADVSAARRGNKNT